MSEPLTLRVLRVVQPIGEFFIGAIDARVLNSIAYVDVRRFDDGNPGEISGIQRELSPSRIKKLREYVTFDYATFPTSVVLAVDERCVTVMPSPGCSGVYDLVISPYQDDETNIPLDQSAFIIDGQHRMAGLEALPSNKSFDINVSIFVGADDADKAEIFSTVNLAQTKVNKSLVYDLFTYANTNSPFKTAHELTIALNRDAKGPLFGKVKRLGVATPGAETEETLSQATVVRGILRHLPKNADVERNKGFLGLSTQREKGESWRKTIFSDYYRSEDRLSMFKILTNYFAAVERRWPAAWNDVEDGYILNRTNGYDALIRFLRDAYVSLCKDSPSIVSANEFGEIFAKVGLSNADFSVANFPPGSSGAGRLYRSLVEQSGI